MCSAIVSIYSMTLLILLFALVALILVTPTISTSLMHTLDDQPNVKTSGFQATLTHMDSGKNLTKIELLQRAIERERKRMERLDQATMGDVESPGLDASIHPIPGGFVMNLSIGTPPLSYAAFVDTGSDLIWTQCQPCQVCFQQPTPKFDPKNSSSYSNVSCSSQLCGELPSLSTCKIDDNCDYEYSYGNNSSTRGDLATETFTFEGSVKVPRVAFGCGVDNKGDFQNFAGLVGLGHGNLSLVSQLDVQQFSYCLAPFGSDNTSILSMGSRVNYSRQYYPDMKTTPLIRNPMWPSRYYLSLQGITIGDTRLPIENSTFAINHEDGSGGVIIDSGTTLTYLEETAFDLLKKELTRQINKLNRTSGDDIHLELCFEIPSDVQISIDQFPWPVFIFHFEGADLELPPENYMFNPGNDENNRRRCLAMSPSPSFRFSILGNIQQQNTLVVYDLAKEALSFLPITTQCDQLRNK